MAPLCIPTLGNEFSSGKPTTGMSKKQIESLYNLKYDGECKISTLDHICRFVDKCESYNIINDNEICRLFT